MSTATATKPKRKYGRPIRRRKVKATTEPSVKEVTIKRKRGRPKGSKNKPKPYAPLLLEASTNKVLAIMFENNVNALEAHDQLTAVIKTSLKKVTIRKQVEVLLGLGLKMEDVIAEV